MSVYTFTALSALFNHPLVRYMYSGTQKIMKYEDDNCDFKKYNEREIFQCTQSISLIFKLLGKLFYILYW